MELIPFAPAYFEALAGWFANLEEVVLWGGPAMVFPLQPGQLAPVVAETQTVPPRRHAWMARQDGRLVGHVEIGLDWQRGVARLGRVAVAPAERGHGFATPMVMAACTRAFAHPEMVRLELNVHPDNHRARRIYDAIGFQAEGVLRSTTPVGAVRWDMVMMSVLRDEWQERHGAAAECAQR